MLNKIKPVKYEWTSDNRYMGIIAQELPPEIVQEEPVNNNITFHPGPGLQPMLVINENGFWVRGVKVEQDEKEAAAVYKAFKQFMVEAELRRQW